MYGSGGSLVAARIAQSLGWSLLDNQLVDAVAERLGVPVSEVQAMEEKVPSLVERLTNAMALTTPELAPAAGIADVPPSEERVVAVTGRIITEAVSEGNVVLVGRGAQCLLATRADAFHIFCYASIGALTLRVSERSNISEEDARREVEGTNAHREQYVKRHWNRRWRAHENYHICLNTGWLGVEGAADAAVAVYRAYSKLIR